MKHLFGNDKQQVVTHGNPDLCVDRIARCSIERFDAQMSFYEFEERLHIPSFAVKFSDGKCGEAKVICDKSINIICCIIFINDHAYPLWIIGGCPWAGKHDVLVADKAGCLVNRSFLNHFKFHVALSPGDKECMLPVEQFVEPLEINVSFIHQVIGKGFYWQIIHCLAVMNLAFREMDECGNAAPKVKQRVHFDGTFPMMEIRPWTKFKAEFYRATVKRIDHLINVKTVIVFVIKFSRFFDEILCKVMVNAPVFFLIHFTKGGTWNERESGMVKLSLKRSQSSFIGTQTLLRGQLCKAHHHELVTAAELNPMTVTIVSCNALTEHVFWEQRHELGEYILTLIHMVCTLHYYQMQKYKFKSSKNFIAVKH